MKGQISTDKIWHNIGQRILSDYKSATKVVIPFCYWSSVYKEMNENWRTLWRKAKCINVLKIKLLVELSVYFETEYELYIKNAAKEASRARLLESQDSYAWTGICYWISTTKCKEETGLVLRKIGKRSTKFKPSNIVAATCCSFLPAMLRSTRSICRFMTWFINFKYRWIEFTYCGGWFLWYSLYAK